MTREPCLSCSTKPRSSYRERANAWSGLLSLDLVRENAAALVEQNRHGLPGYSEVLLRTGRGQPQRFEPLPPYDTPWMRGIAHFHNFALLVVGIRQSPHRRLVRIRTGRSTANSPTQYLRIGLSLPLQWMWSQFLHVNSMESARNRPAVVCNLLGIDLVEPCNQVDRAQMSVPLQHLHALVTADGGHFLVVQTGLDEPTDRFVPQVVKS